ncbi:PREDICTED: thaumatin-like protein 1b [Lupinus angustifolius]|nr:PREDICTED: thaumatin-like protein 1b [Lupinus angustifolius]
MRKPIMSCFSYHKHSSKPLIYLFILSFLEVSVSGTTFTFMNKCDHTVWPGILGKPDLGTTGFELKRGTTNSFDAPTAWSGRFWARTGCNFDDSGHGTCKTGDCNSGEVNCNGNGAAPPATLAEFTLGSGSQQDYYDVSLVDGYNVPMLVEASGGSGACATTGCGADMNRRCPSELRVDGGDACQSACGAFGKDEYCCGGAFNSPSVCKPSVYSEIFKSACPKSYSYAFDDASSTFTCAEADYTITFCPSSFPSLKSLIESGPGSSMEEAAVTTSSWIANLATGESIITKPFSLSIYALFFVALTFIFFPI